MRTIHQKILVPGISSPAELEAYIPYASPIIHPNIKRPAVIICPGGGYRTFSEREAEPVALRFLSLGCNAYILHYHLLDSAHYPIQQLELAKAVSWVRNNSDEMHTDPNKIFVCGFSAGGHLAASLGTGWYNSSWANELDISKEEIKPNGMILCYAVLTGYEHAQVDTLQNLAGEDFSKIRNEIALEKNVNQNTCPAFIWATCEDDLVDMENSLIFAMKLRENSIPLELHIYPHGKHGVSLANEMTTPFDDLSLNIVDCQDWPERAVNWMKYL